MPRKMTDIENMEFYKRIPKNGCKDKGHHHGELCSSCGYHEYEDMLHNIALCKKKVRNYERHCPSCHCPPERQRFFSSGRPKTSENVKAMLNRYERVPLEPISSAIKKSQSSPLSQKVYWDDYQTSIRSHCPKRLLQGCRQRRRECDKYLSDVYRMQGDTVNSELTNEDIETFYEYAQPTEPIKSSLKKYDHCREPKVLPDGQEYSDVDDSELSMKHSQYIQSKKPHASNLKSRSHCINRDGEYVTETNATETNVTERNESDIDCRQDEPEYQEMKKLALELEGSEKLKHDNVSVINKNDKIERQKFDVAKAIKSTSLETPYCKTNKPPVLKESIDKPTREFVLNTHSAKLDLNTTKNRIIESIDQMLSTMGDTKNDAPQQEQTEQETVEKITRELQENGWQLLFNALMIHRDSTDSSKRSVRLECLNHIRQQLDKLYALESTLDNSPLKLQFASSHNVLCNEEHQQSHRLEQKFVDS